MLEICPTAFCAFRVRVPRAWHSHSSPCLVQPPSDAVRVRVTSVWPHTASSRHPRAQVATYVESSVCRNSCGTGLESCSCEQSWVAPRHHFESRLLPAFQIRLTAGHFVAELGAEPDGIPMPQRTLRSPLESALTSKQGWGVPPPGGFLP
jgi:hypothetical protein